MMATSFIKIVTFLNTVYYSNERSYYFDRQKQQDILYQQLLRLKTIQHAL